MDWSAIVITVISTVAGPLLVAWCSRRWSEEDRDLADATIEQLKAELAERVPSESSPIPSPTPAPSSTSADGC